MKRQGTSFYKHRQINICIDRPLDQGIINNQQNQWGFKFEKILSNASQDVVFNLSAK